MRTTLRLSCVRCAAHDVGNCRLCLPPLSFSLSLSLSTYMYIYIYLSPSLSPHDLSLLSMHTLNLISKAKRVSGEEREGWGVRCAGEPRVSLCQRSVYKM